MATSYVVLERHPKHKANVVSAEEAAKLVEYGKRLRAWLEGKKIPLPKHWFSSPQARAIMGGMCLNEGLGTMLALEASVPAFGAAADGTATIDAAGMTELAAQAKAAGVSVEAHMLGDQRWAAKCHDRGLEGLNALLPLAIASTGTLLVSSHGGRIEPIIRVLLPDAPKFVMNEGTVVVLTLNHEAGKVVSGNVEYLGSL